MWSEDQLIRFINKNNRVRRARVGIGDDGAVLNLKPGFKLVVTTDALVEDIHFLRAHIRAEDLGWKSVAVNLSDLAAMGAKPEGLLLNLSLPKDLSPSWIKNFMRGFFAIARAHKVELIGGDTTASRKAIFISVTALGSVSKNQFKTRGRARVGDKVCVTGPLGLSRAGLQLQTKKHKPAYASSLLKAHHRPQPRVKEGQMLAKHHAVSAMLDLSDGLWRDANRLAQASRCGVRLELDRIPLTKDFRLHCARTGRLAVKEALLGGEDYELLYTTAKPGPKDIVIGEIQKGSARVRIVFEGKTFPTKELKSFEHF